MIGEFARVLGIKPSYLYYLANRLPADVRGTRAYPSGRSRPGWPRFGAPIPQRKAAETCDRFGTPPAAFAMRPHYEERELDRACEQILADISKSP